MQINQHKINDEDLRIIIQKSNPNTQLMRHDRNFPEYINLFVNAATSHQIIPVEHSIT